VVAPPRPGVRRGLALACYSTNLKRTTLDGPRSRLRLGGSRPGSVDRAGSAPSGWNKANGSAAAVQAMSSGGGKYGEQTNARDRVGRLQLAAPLGGQSHHDVYEDSQGRWVGGPCLASPDWEIPSSRNVNWIDGLLQSPNPRLSGWHLGPSVFGPSLLSGCCSAQATPVRRPPQANGRGICKPAVQQGPARVHRQSGKGLGSVGPQCARQALRGIVGPLALTLARYDKLDHASLAVAL